MGGKKGNDEQEKFFNNAAQNIHALNQGYANIGNNLQYNNGTYDTGLYGSSTSTKNGTTWTPTSFQTQLVNYAQDNIPTLLNQYLNPSGDSEWYQQNKAIRQQAQQDAFENQVINPLASRNLTRGSSVNALSNMFANDVARQERQALLDDSDRAGQLASQLLNYYQLPYAMMSDSNTKAMQQANLANQYDLAKAQFELNRYNAQNEMSAKLMQILASMQNDGSSNSSKSSGGFNGVGAATGALGGAATGAAAGSVVPGIGTAVGAGVGALAGGALGGLGGK